VEPKAESTTILLPAPSRETTSIKLGASSAGPAIGSITGPIQLPPLPELVEIPAALAVPPEVGGLFAAELAAGKVRLDSKLGVTYAARPERWDDLTLLRGVGEVLQGRLHDCGIFTFKQIAVWTDELFARWRSRLRPRTGFSAITGCSRPASCTI